MHPSRWQPLINVVSVGAVVFLWYLIANSGYVSRAFLPTPHQVWSSMVEGFEHGNLAAQTGATIISMLVGWFACSLVGVVVGCIIGVWPLARLSVGPVLEIFRPMPPAAVVPVAIAILGLSREMSLSVIIFAAVWPALLSTVHGFSAVEPRLREVAQALGISPLAFIWKIALPNATPDIIAGMRLSMVIALVMVVITDMMTGQIGLGSLVVLASRTFDMAGLFAGLALLSLIGLLSNSALQYAERRLLSYKLS